VSQRADRVLQAWIWHTDGEAEPWLVSSIRSQTLRHPPQPISYGTTPDAAALSRKSRGS
jgi:hypothetical protein